MKILSPTVHSSADVPYTIKDSRVKLAIVGSRVYPLPDLVRRYVAGIPRDIVTAIYSGGASGVDTWAIRAASTSGFPCVVRRADWTRGRRAGFNRSKALVEEVDQVTAFWDGASSGTAYTIQIARLAGKLRRVYGPDGTRMFGT